MSKTVDRMPRSSRAEAQARPAMPPPMTATEGSAGRGVAKVTCSWEKLFLMMDLREVPYEVLLFFFLLLGFGLRSSRSAMDVLVARARVRADDGILGFWRRMNEGEAAAAIDDGKGQTDEGGK